MDEESIALNDRQEIVLDVDPEAVDADWNGATDDKTETEGYAEEQDGEDAPEEEAKGGDSVDGGGSDQSFTLKHLSEIRTVGRDEVIALAQKGLDYDRIRGKYDAAAATRSRPQSDSPEPEASARRQSEIRDFLMEYGTGIDPKAIPEEVWQSVAGGKTLLAAYQAWELKKLRAESGAAKKNTENKSRSAGSRFSFGHENLRDAITDDWYEG